MTAMAESNLKQGHLKRRCRFDLIIPDAVRHALQIRPIKKLHRGASHDKATRRSTRGQTAQISEGGLAQHVPFL